MAFHLHFTTPLLLLFSLFFFFTPSHSTCETQKLNRKFDNCTDLPTLNATLHYTYAAANRTLTVAYSATPPASPGWVAWALNLAGGGMLGSEALIAWPVNSAVGVHRYNLTAYKKIDEVKNFTFESWDLAAEQSNGVITIFAAVKLPEHAANVTQVWQVGPIVGGKVSIHATDKANLASKGALPPVVSASSADAPPTNSSSSGGAAPAPSSGAHQIGFYFSMVFALIVGAVVSL
ncbi:hypothetical protein VNO78_24207 [Psophocarpus tetragonolobus]|uniref:DOMON domain-containing protein n=1 Tax=Psophocarpus tetragonolobus TaxID=3891 RepID=A0AAN9S4X2_PSOTE